MRDTAFGAWFSRVFLLTLSLAISSPAPAEGLDPALLPKVQSGTFEVVSAKPESDPLTYEKPLPLDLLPFQERNDKYHSIGTAFALGDNRYATAAHVLGAVLGGLWGPMALRDSDGHVHEVGKIEKFSLERDFVVFSLATPIDGAKLDINENPTLNSTVYTVGNALGSGVVVRDGLYTSNTPEEQDGRWNFMRFSAAASPGNSGGPLLDKDGKVIGIVLRKSPNENLNFALPISEVLKAPDHVAEADSREIHRSNFSDATQIGLFKTQFPLPLDLAAFQTEYQTRWNGFIDTQYAALAAKDPETTFPNGPGSERMLYSLSGANPYPVLIARNNEGLWNPVVKAGARMPLPGNGYVQSGQANGDLMFHWHKADKLSAHDAFANPDKLMGDLLTNGLLQRSVASQQIKVIGLGKPSEDSIYTDRWQRRWQVRVWPLAFGNITLITFALPVPDGYAVMAQIAAATQLHDHMLRLELNTAFVNVSYEGTVAQWQDFLTEKPLLPPPFQGMKVSFASGGPFGYASERVAFTLPQDAQATTAESVLTVGMNFFPGAEKPVWGASVIRLRLNANDSDLITVQRHLKPPADIGNSFENTWDKVSNRKHPFDGVMRAENDITKITAVTDSPADGEAGPLYTVFLEIPGAVSQEIMKSKLDSWLKDFHVTEH